MTSSYFNLPDADVILRTAASGSLDFWVHRCILSSASPFFRQMFTLPQPSRILSQECEVDRPIIDVSESSETLELLLRMVYPMVSPKVDNLDDLTLVLAAAAKYDMLVAVDTLRTLLVSPQFVEAHPTRVYAIASRFELEEEAKIASRHTLGINILDCPLSDDLKYISAYQYHRLLNLHRTRSKAAQELLQLPEGVKCMLCNGTHYGVFLPPKWWKDFRERAGEELRLRPTTDTIFSMPFLARSAQAGCERCAGSILDSYGILQRLKKAIDDLPSTI